MAQPLLKVNQFWKKMLKPRIEYPVDLKEFEDLPRRRIWRLDQSEGSQTVHLHLWRDANMKIINTKKHKFV